MKDQINVKKNVLIPMRDGVELSADLYMPETNDPLPTILKYYPYRKDDEETELENVKHKLAL